MHAMMSAPFTVQTEPFVVDDPGPGQVLLATEASAVSAGTELAIYTGIHQWLADPNRAWPKFPFVPGYSAVGHIVAVGDGVEEIAIGQRVIYAGRHASHGLVDLRTASPVFWPIAEHVPASAAACAPLAQFPLAAVVRCGPVLGQSVAVLGLGMIGQLTLRLFAAAGAYPLFGIDPIAFRRERALASHGLQTLDPGDGEVLSELRELNQGALPDIVVDATGAPNAVRLAMSAVRDGGKVVMVGSPRGIASEVDFYHDLHGRSISLIGAHGSSIGAEPREGFPFTRARALRLIVHLLESGKLETDDLITHSVHTGDLGRMYEGLLHQPEEFLGVTLHWQ
ncbi:MAG: zinc-binding dehydrogenase [Chloroflexota bacterium]|nr:zinc-binding dehydrogenase [Chloroflexota bacterium]